MYKDSTQFGETKLYSSKLCASTLFNLGGDFSPKLQDSNMSSLKKQVEEGVLPYPIFAAIDDDLQDDWREKKVQSKQKIGAEWRWQGNGRH